MRELDRKASPPRAPTHRPAIRAVERPQEHRLERRIERPSPICTKPALLAAVVNACFSPRLSAIPAAPAYAPERRAASAVEAPGPDPNGLANLLLAHRFEEARAYVAARFASGAATGIVMTEDLAPAARRLGALWDQDACDFVDVNIASRALQNLLWEFVPNEQGRLGGRRRSILIGLTPGETHALGADMAVRFFAAAGWRAARAQDAGWLVSLAHEAYDAIGFSLSCDRFAPALAVAIAQARKISCNPALRVLVGGPIFAANLDLAEFLGADGCAADAKAAIQLSCSLLLRARM